MYYNLEIELNFTDGENIKISAGPYPSDSSTVSTFKSTIMSLNSGTIGIQYDPDIYIENKNGAHLVMGDTYPEVPILHAAITAREETEVVIP